MDHIPVFGPSQQIRKNPHWKKPLMGKKIKEPLGRDPSPRTERCAIDVLCAAQINIK